MQRLDRNCIARYSRCDDRQASRHRRLHVRGRRWHGDEARADFCGSRDESVLGAPPQMPDDFAHAARSRLRSNDCARTRAASARIALICGHYEGVDERVREHLATDEISIGDYVLTGGEIPAMVIVDAVARLDSRRAWDIRRPRRNDSHASGLLEGPHYTRPADFRGWKVPEVLLSGNHAQVLKWRRRESLRRTFERRPDLLDKIELNQEEIEFLKALGWRRKSKVKRQKLKVRQPFWLLPLTFYFFL